MDVTPLVPQGRQVIEAYGDNGFRISGVRYDGSVLVLPDRTLNWAVATSEDITAESLVPVTDHEETELLLLGFGKRPVMLSQAFRDTLRSKGVSLEPMDTGAASRTYNVLLAEGRRVAAALIAVE
ncbi:Mth938-like domain-containing protein [Fodinicurvata halophila]|uniref:Mth938-like domain-containing protein n=1 Tax=Fodinicurvata halophila TaxID=1419723 RepID=A0ABV8UL61_9PROT